MFVAVGFRVSGGLKKIKKKTKKGGREKKGITRNFRRPGAFLSF